MRWLQHPIITGVLFMTVFSERLVPERVQVFWAARSVVSLKTEGATRHRRLGYLRGLPVN